MGAFILAAMVVIALVAYFVGVWLTTNDNEKVRKNTIAELEALFDTNLARLEELGKLQKRSNEPSFTECGRAGALKSRLHCLISAMKIIATEGDDIEYLTALEGRRAHIDTFYTGWPGRVEEEFDPQ